MARPLRVFEGEWAPREGRERRAEHAGTPGDLDPLDRSFPAAGGRAAQARRPSGAAQRPHHELPHRGRAPHRQPPPGGGPLPGAGRRHRPGLRAGGGQERRGDLRGDPRGLRRRRAAGGGVGGEAARRREEPSAAPRGAGGPHLPGRGVRLHRRPGRPGDLLPPQRRARSPRLREAGGGLAGPLRRGAGVRGAAGEHRRGGRQGGVTRTMLTLIENGEVYAPEPRGKKPVLLAGDKIARVGETDPKVAAPLLGLELDVIDAAGCVVTPGVIDPHSHLIGGSGEECFASRTPEIQLSEIVTWGITTVVGVLGVDATTRPTIRLLAKVKGLREEGMTAYLHAGHYGIPPATLSGSVRNDLMLVDEVIGVGEI